MDLSAIDWAAERDALDRDGFVHTGAVLDAAECTEVRRLYADDGNFRSRVVMERHGFGVGDYAYFADPIPRLVNSLRSGLYKRLVPTANRWMERCGREQRFPASMRAMRALSRRHGQTLPTPLVLHYRADGYNCLHRDLYGELVFPLQAAIFLSRPERDYRGGEFLLVENRPRSQSIGHVLRPDQGEMVIFASYEHPVRGARGYYRAAMRHGIAKVTGGERYTLGIIFHDAT